VALSADSDVLLVVTAAPYASDTVTTVLRLTDALLRAEAAVRVWCCGYATMLTQRVLGEAKPRDVTQLAQSHPTTLTLVSGLLVAHPDTLAWDVCGFCCADRGASEQLPAVRVRPPSRLADAVAHAAKTIYIGGA
jgi:sulfur relay (sulfurtransferase) complex TusBCD TusD component (DsrE family)